MAPLTQKKITIFFQDYLNTNRPKKRRKLLNHILRIVTLTDKINRLGDTLIHFVISHGQPVDIGDLSTRLMPGQMNIQNDFGETPLMQIAREGRQTIVSLLLYYGADADVKDHEGKSIADYQAMSKKPIALVPSPLIHYLAPIYQYFQKIENSKDIHDLQEYLTINHIEWHQAIDRDDNTIAFYVLLASTLEGMKAFLPYLTPNLLQATNCEGQTVLHLLIERGLHVKANILIHAGASLDCQDFNQRTPLTYATQNNTPLRAISVETYLQFYDVCRDFSIHLDCQKLLTDIAHLGFCLDEGVDELDNTPLHHLVKFLPYPAIERVLANHPDCQLDCVNALGVNIRDMVAQDGRRSVIQLITQYLAPNHRVPLQAAYVTVYEDLQALFKTDHQPFDSDNDIVIKHFGTYINYFKRNRYRYHGTVRDGYILDGVSGQSYVVNCYDLTIGFGFLLRENGFHDIRVHSYHNIISRRFNDKGSLAGDYVCFDALAHQNEFVTRGFYSFDVHYVLQVNQHFFDPTFCCHYHHADDVLAVLPPMKVQKRSIIVEIAYPLASTQHKINFLGLKVSASLMTQFSLKHWHHEFERDCIRIHCQNKQLLIERNSQSISFTAVDMSKEELSKTLNNWLRITQIDHYTVSIEADLQDDQDFLYKQLPSSELSLKSSQRSVI